PGGTTPRSSAALSLRCSGVTPPASRSAATGAGRGDCRSSGLCGTGRLRQLRQLLRVAVGVEADVSDLRHQLGRVLEVEPDERCDVRLSRLRVVHVDHERARERRVRAAGYRLLGRQNTVTATVDRYRPPSLRVLDVVGVAEVAERVRVTLDALHEHVVVLGRRVVAAARTLLA